MPSALIALNVEMERKWRAGEITTEVFLWHLLHICGA